MAKQTNDYTTKLLAPKTVSELQKLGVELAQKLSALRSTISRPHVHEIAQLRRAIARIKTMITARQTN